MIEHEEWPILGHYLTARAIVRVEMTNIAKDFTWPPSAADELFVQVRHRVSSDEPCRVRVQLTRNGWEVSRSLAAIQTAGWSESK